MDHWVPECDLGEYSGPLQGWSREDQLVNPYLLDPGCVSSHESAGSQPDLHDQQSGGHKTANLDIGDTCFLGEFNIVLQSEDILLFSLTYCNTLSI